MINSGTLNARVPVLIVPPRPCGSATVEPVSDLIPLPRAVALIAVGAAAGALLRTGIAVLLPFDPVTNPWPWATLIVNVIGSLLMGVFIGRISISNRIPPNATPLISTGFLGGLTTFSAFALDAVELAGSDRLGMAAGYTAITVVAAWLAVRVGWAVGAKEAAR